MILKVINHIQKEKDNFNNKQTNNLTERERKKR